MGYTVRLWAIIYKDLVSEFRTKELFSSMFVFALLVLIIFNFAFSPGTRELQLVTAPGILWVAFTFAGALGLGRSFALEREKDCIHGLMLCPGDRGIIFLAKFLGNLLFMGAVEVITLPLFAIFFNVRILPILPSLTLILFLSTIGFASVGTLFAAMAAATKTREVLLPILLFPVAVPVIIAAVKSTGRVLEGRPLSEIAPWLNMLLSFDVIFLVICYITFEYVVEE
ncbi:MAG: heme exporter protein CcmB [candidate division NC10 bacterium]|nr:heme exporter protein CcmB [candidate division NC10 bacterium]